MRTEVSHLTQIYAQVFNIKPALTGLINKDEFQHYINTFVNAYKQRNDSFFNMLMEKGFPVQ